MSPEELEMLLEDACLVGDLDAAGRICSKATLSSGTRIGVSR